MKGCREIWEDLELRLREVVIVEIVVAYNNNMGLPVNVENVNGFHVG